MNKIKVKNFTNKNGNAIPNQFIIDEKWSLRFQSYDSIIAIKYKGGATVIDCDYWDYSVTTRKYRNQFLGETTAETLKKIKSGEYHFEKLNG